MDCGSCGPCVPDPDNYSMLSGSIVDQCPLVDLIPGRSCPGPDLLLWALAWGEWWWVPVFPGVGQSKGQMWMGTLSAIGAHVGLGGLPSFSILCKSQGGPEYKLFLLYHTS